MAGKRAWATLEEFICLILANQNLKSYRSPRCHHARSLLKELRQSIIKHAKTWAKQDFRRRPVDNIILCRDHDP